ncbi:unnamed protein product, partial [Darwinula stevensoni]
RQLRRIHASEAHGGILCRLAPAAHHTHRHVRSYLRAEGLEVLKMSAYASASLWNKLCIVTGAGSGIGRAICRLIAEEGGAVIAADRNGRAAEETIASLTSDLAHEAVSIDVASKTTVLELMRGIESRKIPGPSVLINCAGVTRDNFLLKMDEESFTDVLNVNLKGTFLMTQAVAHLMIKKGITDGSVVNFSSVVAKHGNMGQCNYAASKAGVEAFTKTAAKELAQYGIRVNAVVPGFTATPMTATVPDKVIQKLLSLTPLRRMARPEEIAEVAVFLASKRSSYITGACIDVTGG